jgi:TonB family protein
VEESIETARPSKTTRAPLSRIPVEFPPAAYAAGIEGFAVVQFGVTPGGETEDLLIVASEPPLIFDGATLRAVREWLFVEAADAAEQSRQVIRILFLHDSGITVEEAERLTE